MSNSQSHNFQFGRVTRAATIGFDVGCRVNELTAVSFGGLVKAIPKDTHEAVYGLVYNINIDDDSLSRRLIMAEDPPVELINDQRENRLLPVEMNVMAVGYRQNQKIIHGLPPRPPLNLDPVELVRDPAEIKAFSDKLGYLRLILRANSDDVPVEQLLVAHVRDFYRLRGSDVSWATAVTQELIELLRSNYDVLIPTLEALSDALPELKTAVVK